MPKKTFQLDDDVPVTVYKRKSSRHLRLTLTPSGQIRVSIPAWSPYKAGLDFARSREAWIRSQSHRKQLLAEGQAVGKAHHLHFIEKSGLARPAGRLTGWQIRVYVPAGEWTLTSAAVQKAAEQACIRALRQQAEQLLPRRLADLAERHGYLYGKVKIKRMSGRWGSCDDCGNITLNLFLMQLPWELIDYVLLHELTHTKILRHGPPFWQAMASKLPDVATRRRLIRSHLPVLAAAG